MRTALKSWFLNSGGGFIYGDLEQLFPNISYDSIKAKRLSNWELFKSLCDRKKSSNGTVYLSNRIEMFVPSGDKISMASGIDSLNVQGSSKESTNLVFYPLTPTENLTQNIFDLQINTSLTLRNLKISRDEIKKYETYACTLKKSSNSKLIELSGSIRPEFWNNLTVGKTIFYAWAFEIQGEKNTIASWDSVAKTITVTNNINAAVSNDQSGPYVNIGTYFEESISLSDYNNYGNYWYLAEGMNFIYHSYSLTDQPDTVITYDNVILSGAENNTYIGSGACKVYATDTRFTKCQIGLAFFSQDKGNNQQLHLDNLTFDDCGYSIVGGITTSTAGNILGSGAYLHPSIAVKKINTGRLILTNNIAGAFRQFSSSGTKPIASGSTSEYGIITATGNTEYDLITSNSMPVTIDEINSDYLVNAGGDLVITTGDLEQFRLTPQAQPASEVASTSITLNNCHIRGLQTFGWNATQQGKTTVTYDGCTFHSKTLAALTSMFESETSDLKKLNLLNSSYVKGASGGDYFTSFGGVSGLTLNSYLIRIVNFKEVYFESFTTENLYGTLLYVTQQFTNADFLKSFTFQDCAINVLSLSGGGVYYYRHSYRFSGVRTSVINSCVASLGNNNVFSQKAGSTTKSIVASDNYALPDDTYGTLSDVLELDYDHDEYTVNAGNIKVVGPIQQRNLSNTLRKAIAANALGNEVIIHAQGGDLVFQQFDASTNPNSNIKNNYTCLNGESCRLIPDTKDVLSTNPNSSTFVNVAVGNGVATTFFGELGNPDPATLLKVVGTATVTAGSVTGTIDSNGVITGVGIVEGQIDFWGPSYYIKFSIPPPLATNIRFDFDLYNGHKFTGSLTVAAL